MLWVWRGKICHLEMEEADIGICQQFLSPLLHFAFIGADQAANLVLPKKLYIVLSDSMHFVSAQIVGLTASRQLTIENILKI